MAGQILFMKTRELGTGADRRTLQSIARGAALARRRRTLRDVALAHPERRLDFDNRGPLIPLEPPRRPRLRREFWMRFSDILIAFAMLAGLAWWVVSGR